MAAGSASTLVDVVGLGLGAAASRGGACNRVYCSAGGLLHKSERRLQKGDLRSLLRLTTFQVRLFHILHRLGGGLMGEILQTERGHLCHEHGEEVAGLLYVTLRLCQLLRDFGTNIQGSALKVLPLFVLLPLHLPSTGPFGTWPS